MIDLTLELSLQSLHSVGVVTIFILVLLCLFLYSVFLVLFCMPFVLFFLLACCMFYCMYSGFVIPWSFPFYM